MDEGGGGATLDRIEWPTIALLVTCYGLWLCALALASGVSLWLGLPLAALLVALHSSLQHEALHGHPTRHAALNEALVALPVGLLIPYRRFRTLHLRHHNDERLTDPYDDPESWFVSEGQWDRISPLMRAVLRFNSTLFGRLLIGPVLSMIGLWRHDLHALRGGDTSIVDAYLRHALAVLIVLAIVWGVFGINPLIYFLFAAYPGMSLLMLRTYAEHRAHETPQGRSVVVENAPFFGLLFLNNNLHVVHHSHPRVAWYRLPQLFRQQRERFLTVNDGYRFDGYGQIVRQHLFRAANPIAHPIWHRRGQDAP